MGEKRAYKARKPGGGRKKLKPEYDAGKNLKEQMESAVALYNSEMSLQAIGDALNLNPIKVRKLLIKAIKPPYSQLQMIFYSPKPPLLRTCLMKKVCTSQAQQKKRKSVLEQSGSGDIER